MRVDKNLWATILGLFFSALVFAHPINDYYKSHKNDKNMEARVVPPKMAALIIDEDYTEAIDVLKSLSALKYLNYTGNQNKVSDYVSKAIKAKGDYKLLLEDADKKRNISVFGIKKKGMVRKLMAVVHTKTQFILLIGKGKLTNSQIEYLPELAKEL